MRTHTVYKIYSFSTAKPYVLSGTFGSINSWLQRAFKMQHPWVAPVTKCDGTGHECVFPASLCT
eukprot:12794076-Ditylum_brightwellii.AAC.1